MNDNDNDSVSLALPALAGAGRHAVRKNKKGRRRRLFPQDSTLRKTFQIRLSVLKVQEAQKISQESVHLAIPDFGDLKPSKEVTDWNDLVRLKGREIARSQIVQSLKSSFL